MHPPKSPCARCVLLLAAIVSAWHFSASSATARSQNQAQGDVMEALQAMLELFPQFANQPGRFNKLENAFEDMLGLLKGHPKHHGKHGKMGQGMNLGRMDFGKNGGQGKGGPGKAGQQAGHKKGGKMQGGMAVGPRCMAQDNNQNQGGKGKQNPQFGKNNAFKVCGNVGAQAGNRRNGPQGGAGNFQAKAKGPIGGNNAGMMGMMGCPKNANFGKMPAGGRGPQPNFMIQAKGGHQPGMKNQFAMGPGGAKGGPKMQQGPQFGGAKGGPKMQQGPQFGGPKMQQGPQFGGAKGGPRMPQGPQFGGAKMQQGPQNFQRNPQMMFASAQRVGMQMGGAKFAGRKK